MSEYFAVSHIFIANILSFHIFYERISARFSHFPKNRVKKRVLSRFKKPFAIKYSAFFVFTNHLPFFSNCSQLIHTEFTYPWYHTDNETREIRRLSVSVKTFLFSFLSPYSNIPPQSITPSRKGRRCAFLNFWRIYRQLSVFSITRYDEKSLGYSSPVNVNPFLVQNALLWQFP